jgi:hypothetical protein
MQVQATDRFADLSAWMQRHLDEDLSIGVLPGAPRSRRAR